jgi:hypothetical protein
MLTEITYRQAFAHISRGEYEPCLVLLQDALMQLPEPDKTRRGRSLDLLISGGTLLVEMREDLSRYEVNYRDAIKWLTNKLAPLSKTPPYEPSEGQ